MTDCQTATLLPVPQTTTPTLDLGCLAERLVCQWRMERKMFLAWADERECLLGITPRTAVIRRWWREQGEPSLD